MAQRALVGESGGLISGFRLLLTRSVTQIPFASRFPKHTLSGPCQQPFENTIPYTHCCLHANGFLPKALKVLSGYKRRLHAQVGQARNAREPTPPKQLPTTDRWQLRQTPHFLSLNATALKVCFPHPQQVRALVAGSGTPLLTHMTGFLPFPVLISSPSYRCFQKLPPKSTACPQILV